MGDDKSNKGILDGILGGMIVSLTNSIFRNDKYDSEIEEWDRSTLKMIFNSFSDEVERKLEGYRLKYNIDESRIKSKFINLIEIENYIYEIQLSNKEIIGSFKSFKTETNWKTIEEDISRMVEVNLNNGLNIFDDRIARYWVYSVKEKLDYMKIIISNKDLSKFYSGEEDPINKRYVYEEYICLDIEEAQSLAKEMKRYYHNHIDRVLIIEEVNLVDKDKIKDINLQTKSIKFGTLKRINKIKTFKYLEISRVLKDYNPKNKTYLIYSLYSLSTELHRDDYSNYSLIILKELLKLDKNLLVELNLNRKINEDILNIYIDLKSESRIKDLIENKYKEDYNFLFNLADRLYSLELYKSAYYAYNIITKNEDSITSRWQLFEAYKKTQDDEGMRKWRDKLRNRGKETWEIDRYLRDEDPEALDIKIRNSWDKEDWKGVIYYSNKYIKFILKYARENISQNMTYQFKKIDAYIKLQDYNGAWNSTCRARYMLISNFEGIDSFYYLSKVEYYMTDISLEENCFIDTIYHHILNLVYYDIYIFFKSNDKNEAIWKIDEFLKDMLEDYTPTINTSLESIIKNEYEDISNKTIKSINTRIINLLEENGYILKMTNPKKYFPTTIFRGFAIK